jgi:hypothetical protein
MLDDEINKEISEAADQYHPAYDDKAWERMEQMLDEHLPQKKDRRRILFFLLFTAIVGAGLLFIFYQREKNITSANALNTAPGNKTENDHKTTAVLPNEASDNKNNANDVTTSPVNENDNTKQQTSIASRIAPIYSNRETGLKNNSSNANANIKDDQGSKTNIDNATAEANAINNQDTSPATTEITNNKTPSAPVTNEANNENAEANGQETPKKETNVKPKDSKNTKSTDKHSKGSKSFANNFAINASTGPDVSGVTFSKIGKVTFAYGAGLSYDLSKKFTVRTGFYVAKKIYSASESDYHSNTVNYNYLQSIDADCKVYEIPLVINYNFGMVKNHRWFASAGLSSYLMKKESYVYYYKYPSGNNNEKSLSISNKNKHYFSVLDLSAGYQYMVNKRLSLMAEPYLRVALSGIGAGKIKLNSGGILFTVILKPFKK